MFSFLRFWLILGVLTAPFGTAAVRASLAVMPMEAHLQMPREGNRALGDIEVYNGSATPLHIDTSLADWDLTPEGKYQFAPAGTQPGLQSASCASWISLNPAEFTLAPKKSLRVRYAVTPPAALGGERRAMIFFQSRPVPIRGQARLNLQVSMRIAYKLFVGAPDAPPALAKISDMGWQTPQNRLAVTVQNPGLTTFRAAGTLTVRDEGGNVVAQGDMTTAQVLPGATRQIFFKPKTPLAPGSYRFQTEVNYGAKTLLGGALKARVEAAKPDPPLPSPISTSDEATPPDAK